MRVGRKKNDCSGGGGGGGGGGFDDDSESRSRSRFRQETIVSSDLTVMMILSLSTQKLTTNTLSSGLRPYKGANFGRNVKGNVIHVEVD